MENKISTKYIPSAKNSFKNLSYREKSDCLHLVKMYTKVFTEKFLFFQLNSILSKLMFRNSFAVFSFSSIRKIFEKLKKPTS